MCIDAISYLLGKKKGGGETPTLIDKNISVNGTYNASSDEADGYKKVVVNVPPTTYPDWSAIGYQGTPQALIDEFAYAKEIYDNWDGRRNFQNDTNLVIMPNVDFSNIQLGNYYFMSCNRLVYLPNLNIKSDNLYGLFYYCSSLEYADLSNFDTTNTISVGGLFENCNSLKEADLSSFELMPSCTCNSLFKSCTKLQKVDVRKLEFSKLNSGNYENMFGTSTAHRPPANCLFIVKDTTEKQWFNTNFSWLTNVQTVEEYENNL